MKQEIEISTIIPIFNDFQFLAEAIVSALNAQGNYVGEILVVDDGSLTKNSHEIKQISNRLGVRYERLNANRGLASARNYGIANTSGKLIRFLDADDVLLPDAVKLLDHLRVSPDHVGAIGNFQFSSDDLVKTWKTTLRKPDESKNWFDILIGWESEITAPIHSACFRRSTISKLESPFRTELSAKEDFVFWMDLSKLGALAAIDVEVAIYRQHGSNMCRDNVAMAQNLAHAYLLYLSENESSPDQRRVMSSSLALKIAETLKAPTTGPVTRWMLPLAIRIDNWLIQRRWIYRVLRFLYRGIS